MHLALDGYHTDSARNGRITQHAAVALVIWPASNFVSWSLAFRHSLQACTIMHNRRFGRSALNDLIAQMQLYKAGMAPYDLQFGGEGFNAKAWWTSVTTPSSTVLAALAQLLLDIVPHAAATERIFSMLGWFHTKFRNSLSVTNTDMMATTAQHYLQQRAPTLPKKRKMADSGEEVIEVEPCAIGAAQEDVDDEFDIGDQDIDDLIAGLMADEPAETFQAAPAQLGLALLVQPTVRVQQDHHTYSLADLLSPWSANGININDAALDPFQEVSVSAPSQVVGALGGDAEEGPIDVHALVAAELAIAPANAT